MTYAPYVTVPVTGLSTLRGAILPIGVTHHSLTLPVIPMGSLRTCKGQWAILRRMLGDMQFAMGCRVLWKLCDTCNVSLWPYELLMI
jgi:hypothetical protein